MHYIIYSRYSEAVSKIHKKGSVERTGRHTRQLFAILIQSFIVICRNSFIEMVMMIIVISRLAIWPRQVLSYRGIPKFPRAWPSRLWNWHTNYFSVTGEGTRPFIAGHLCLVGKWYCALLIPFINFLFFYTRFSLVYRITYYAKPTIYF